jgi:hypothetical protein
MLKIDALGDKTPSWGRAPVRREPPNASARTSDPAIDLADPNKQNLQRRGSQTVYALGHDNFCFCRDMKQPWKVFAEGAADRAEQCIVGVRRD